MSARNTIVYSVAVILTIVGAVVLLNDDSASPPPTQTVDPFEKIEIGMSYKNVQALIGGDGKLMSETGDEDYKLTMYSWGGGFDAIVVSFENGEVVSKARSGN